VREGARGSERKEQHFVAIRRYATRAAPRGGNCIREVFGYIDCPRVFVVPTPHPSAPPPPTSPSPSSSYFSSARPASTLPSSLLGLPRRGYLSGLFVTRSRSCFRRRIFSLLFRFWPLSRCRPAARSRDSNDVFSFASLFFLLDILCLFSPCPWTNIRKERD
jgi:hypothetical protein